jgi:hypothetical protein
MTRRGGHAVLPAKAFHMVIPAKAGIHFDFS